MIVAGVALVVLIGIVIGIVIWMSKPENGQTKNAEPAPVAFANIGHSGAGCDISNPFQLKYPIL